MKGENQVAGVGGNPQASEGHRETCALSKAREEQEMDLNWSLQAIYEYFRQYTWQPCHFMTP